MSNELTDLFSRDPFEYEKRDIQEIIRIYREKFKTFKAGGTLAGKVKAVTGKAAETHAAIEDKGLDI